MTVAIYILAILVVALLVGLVLQAGTVVVYEHERGIHFKRGRLEGVLGPGSYFTLTPRLRRIIKFDTRPNYIAVPGQEVISADGAGLKVTVSVKYRVSDPLRAVTEIAEYHTGLYTVVQLALREIVAASPVDAVIERRAEINARLVEAAAGKTAQFGVDLMEAEIKDVMFPGELKRAFAQVVKARQDGLAALERARGETAALRNLANAAALLEERPALLQLRLLQELGQSTGHTIVLGLNGVPTVLPGRSESRGPES